MKLFSESLPFYRGNLHAHTTCSDGQKTPKECMADYRAAGYDFLSITDHRMVTKPDPALSWTTPCPINGYIFRALVLRRL